MLQRRWAAPGTRLVVGAVALLLLTAGVALADPGASEVAVAAGGDEARVGAGAVVAAAAANPVAGTGAVAAAGAGAGGTTEDAAARRAVEAAAKLDVTFREVAEGVWLHTSYREVEGWGRVRSNGLIVARGAQEAVLVDTAWDDAQTSAVYHWVLQALGRRVTAAVATHAHQDKMGGMGELLALGVSTFAHAASNEAAPARGLRPAEGALHFDREGEALQVPASVAGRTGDEPELTVDASALDPVTVFFPGAGHTHHNLVVAVPSVGVVFGGCLIRPAAATTLGNTADGDVDAWAGTVRRVSQRFPGAGIVIPSHGPVGGREVLAHTIALAEQAAGEN